MKLSIALSTLALTSADSVFESWKAQHGKKYASDSEYNKRLSIFLSNKLKVEEHNAKKLGWTMSLNKYADMTEDEFNKFYLGFKPTFSGQNSTDVHKPVFTQDSLPASVDWRTTVMVGPVKNQGSCGSCWAFSTIASAEGQIANATGTYVSLSEQNLVDCVKGEGVPYDPTTCCDGCQGGLMDNSFAYVVDKQNGEFQTEESYKYTGRNGQCKFNSASAGGKIIGFKDVRPGAKTPSPATAAEEANCKDAAASVGPLSIAVDAAHGWQLYSGGIMKKDKGGLFGCSGEPNKADHGVAVVGYGTDAGEDYWIIRNSWGASWGEKGYIRLPYGENACGIANFASYPTIK